MFNFNEDVPVNREEKKLKRARENCRGISNERSHAVQLYERNTVVSDRQLEIEHKSSSQICNEFRAPSFTA